MNNIKFIKKYFYTRKFKQYNNIVEVLFVSEFVRKFAGAAVFVLKNVRGDRVSTEFSYIGFILFLLWACAYFFCAFKSFVDDQTILRNLYNTKLKYYGDYYEKIVSVIHAGYALWKVPFDISGGSRNIQEIVNIDIALKHLGEKVDLCHQANLVLIFSMLQWGFGFARLISIWGTLSNFNIDIPHELLFQVVYNDALALIITAHYCSYLIMLKKRYEVINNVLRKIKEGNSWEYTVMVRNKPANMGKALDLQAKYISEKVRGCAVIYSMLYKASGIVNDMYGLSLVIMSFMSLMCVVLNSFYFMEATASGLYNDLKRYAYFIVYIVWQNVYALGKIYLSVYFCVSVVNEAKITSFVIHEVINSNVSPRITEEAMKMSLQLLHQEPRFTARGLFNLDYVLLLSGIRSVTTFLVLLLQFATDSY